MASNKKKRPNLTQERCEFLMRVTGCTLTDAFNALTICKDNLQNSQIFIEEIQRRRRHNGKEKIGS